MKVLIGLFLCIIPFFGYSQLPAFSEEIPDFIYHGMDNVVSVKLNQADPELVNFKATNSSRISRYTDSLFAVYPSALDSECVLKLYYKNIIVEQKKVKLQPNLQLRVYLKNESNGMIKLKDIKDCKEFVLSDAQIGISEKQNFRLLSAGLTIYNEKGQISYSGNIRDGVFNEQINDIIKKLMSGSRLVLSNPRAVNLFNQNIHVEPFKEWIIVE